MTWHFASKASSCLNFLGAVFSSCELCKAALCPTVEIFHSVLSVADGSLDLLGACVATEMTALIDNLLSIAYTPSSHISTVVATTFSLD